MPTLSWRFLCRTRTLPGFVFHIRSNVPPPSSSHPFKNIACHRFAPEDAFFNGDAPRATPRVLLVGKDRGGATLKVFLMRTVNETNSKHFEAGCTFGIKTGVRGGGLGNFSVPQTLVVRARQKGTARMLKRFTTGKPRPSLAVQTSVEREKKTSLLMS